MNIHRAAVQIARQLTDLAKVALFPDHPMMFHGPDLIAGVEGHLYAFFIPWELETRRPAELLYRST